MKNDKIKVYSTVDFEDADVFDFLINDITEDIERVLPKDYSIIVKGIFRKWNGSNTGVKAFADIYAAVSELASKYGDVDFFVQDNILTMDGYRHDATDTYEIYIYNEPSAKRWYKENIDDDVEQLTANDFVVDAIRSGDINLDELVNIACKGFGSEILKLHKLG